uniref:Uncharacterized protein n=1 Tax=Oryza glaberrima TaxID=4538 RepID=I1QDC3_ORYGL
MSTTGRALLVALAAVLLVTGDALLAPAGGQEQYTKAPAEAHKGYSIVPGLFSAQECNYFESTQIPSIRKFLHQYDPLGIRFVFLITIHMMAV